MGGARFWNGYPQYIHFAYRSRASYLATTFSHFSLMSDGFDVTNEPRLRY